MTINKIQKENLNLRFYLFWLFIGLSLRLLLMPLFFSEDFISITNNAGLLFGKGVLNIYDFTVNEKVSSLSIAKVYGGEESHRVYWCYMPLTYYILGSFYGLLGLFGATGDSLIPSHIERFLGKLPFLIFDLLTIFILIQFFDKPAEKRISFRSWMISPVVLYISFFIGQMDILAVFFITLSFLILKRNKILLAALVFGLSIAIKYYSLILLPIIILVYFNNWKERLIFAGVSLGTFIFFIAPFLNSKAFFSTCFFSYQAQSILSGQLFLQNSQFLSVFLTPYAVFLSFLFVKQVNLKNKLSDPENNKFEILIFSNLAILSIFFAFTSFNLQWFLWIIPFLIFFKIKYPKSRLLISAIAILYFLIFLAYPGDPFWRLFSLANSEILNKIFLPVYHLCKILNLNKFLIVFRSFFSGLLLALALLNLIKINNKQS